MRYATLAPTLAPTLALIAAIAGLSCSPWTSQRQKEVDNCMRRCQEAQQGHPEDPPEVYPNGRTGAWFTRDACERRCYGTPSSSDQQGEEDEVSTDAPPDPFVPNQ